MFGCACVRLVGIIPVVECSRHAAYFGAANHGQGQTLNYFRACESTGRNGNRRARTLTHSPVGIVNVLLTSPLARHLVLSDGIGFEIHGARSVRA